MCMRALPVWKGGCVKLESTVVHPISQKPPAAVLYSRFRFAEDVSCVCVCVCVCVRVCVCILTLLHVYRHEATRGRGKWLSSLMHVDSRNAHTLHIAPSMFRLIHVHVHVSLNYTASWWWYNIPPLPFMPCSRTWCTYIPHDVTAWPSLNLVSYTSIDQIISHSILPP